MTWLRKLAPSASLLALGGGLFLWASNNVASAAVQPVAGRVMALEAHREDDVQRLSGMREQLDRIEDKLDELARRSR